MERRRREVTSVVQDLKDFDTKKDLDQVCASKSTFMVLKLLMAMASSLCTSIAVLGVSTAFLRAPLNYAKTVIARPPGPCNFDNAV